MSGVQDLIDYLWDFNDPAASEARFRDAVEQCSEEPWRLELLTQLARAQGLQRKFDEAHRTLDEIAHAIAPHGNAVSPAHALASAHVRCLLERGRVFNSSGQRETALPLFEAAFTAAGQLENHHLAIDAAHMVAIVQAAQGCSDDALQWNQRALALAESSDQPRARRWRASLHNNIGWSMHDQVRFEEALRHFDQALALRQEAGKPEEMRVARWCIGRCLRSLGRLHDALAVQQALLADATNTAAKDPFVHEEIAECLHALGRATEAVPHFAAAHAGLKRDARFSTDHPVRLARLAGLGGVE